MATDSTPGMTELTRCPAYSHRHIARLGVGLSVLTMILFVSGCHDGPLYALKVANPYYSMYEWRKEAAYQEAGLSRLQELEQINKEIASLSPTQQTEWAVKLREYVKEDPSPEIRRLAVVAASKLQSKVDAQGVIETALDDRVVKVRMEACRSLGKLGTDEAARLLVATLNTDTTLDVQHSAIAALENYQGEVSMDSLRRILEDRNPATRALAMSTLRGVTGEEHGNNPIEWIAALDQRESASPTSKPSDLPNAFGGTQPIMAAGYTGVGPDASVQR